MSESKPNADNAPLDPNSDPEAMQGLTKSDLRKAMLAITAALTPGVGIGLILVAGSVGRRTGATRTYQLEWQRRQAEIESVVAEAELTRDAIVQDVAHETILQTPEAPL